ncbi:MAG: NAD(P)-dependent oxidoreductase, partial [Alistipes sp.]|nr:NAD(P)-dependent oxidoreductase [Alistipes sp.]
LTNYRFEQLLLKNSLGLPPEKLFASNMFATRNFHGQWYLDSDRLEEILHFRAGTPVEEYFAGLQKQLPWFFALARYVPAIFMRLFLRYLAHHKRFGTLGWLRNDDKEHIAAYFGSREEWEKTPDWKTLADFKLANEEDAVRLNHGYDEQKDLSKLNIDDMQQAATFRGGKCLSPTMTEGDLHTPLEWECACGHRFTTSPTVVLLGGHWCPECFSKPWQYDAEAKRNPFFAQLWLAHHKGENNDYSESIIDIKPIVHRISER